MPKIKKMKKVEEDFEDEEVEDEDEDDEEEEVEEETKPKLLKRFRATDEERQPASKEESNKERYAVTEVATQTSPVIVDVEKKTQLELIQVVCNMANDIEEIKKAVC